MKDKQILEQMQREVKTNYEAKGLDKEIVAVTKAISVIRKNKVDWHSRMTMQVA